MIHNILKGMAILLAGIAILFIAKQSPAMASNTEAESKYSAALQGRVIDTETREGVGFVNILIQEANRSVTSDENGFFNLSGLPVGYFTVKTFRIGYQNTVSGLQLLKSDTSHITLLITKAQLTTQEVVVVANRSGNTLGIKPALLISDRKLHQNLGKTIAETMDYEPGISQRTMGPAPARPVMRGLDGDRLLVLEDGEIIGDLSATSADHAVVIEPVTAERIEIIRGPQSLIYGSNTIGGVVNVVRGAIPLTVVAHSTGSLTVQNETVNSGLVAAGDMTVPLGIFTGRYDASIRKADDIHTPVGVLVNTDIKTVNSSVGIGLSRKWGATGITAGIFESAYGIPPDPNGGHPRGVDINLRRQHEEFRLELHAGIWSVQRIELLQNFNRYYHEELEANGNLGMNFGVVTHSGDARLYLKSGSFFKNGIVGLSGQYRDYKSGGLSFTPAASEYSNAVYYYQEVGWRRLQLSASGRYNMKIIKPEEEAFSRITGFIRKRSFNGYAAAVTAHYMVCRDLVLNAAVIRTFRAPGVEELFSEGPHLAAYSYDVGNADLDAESGIGTEISAEYNGVNKKAQFTLFRNQIDNYLLPVNTGVRSWRRADLYVYQYLGEPVLMQGVEASWDLQVYRQLFVTGSMGYVWAEFTGTGTPIPRIPPLEGKLTLRYAVNKLNIGATVQAADKQTRLGEFEKRTAGYAVLSLYLQYYLSGGPFLHTVTITGGNVTNREYRKHLNRVKEIMPEPGSNIKILYKVFF